jgi:hypothetical protein
MQDRCNTSLKKPGVIGKLRPKVPIGTASPPRGTFEKSSARSDLRMDGLLCGVSGRCLLSRNETTV